MTGEYKEKIPGVSTIISDQDSKIISDAIETLAQENAKFANQRNATIISRQEETIKRVFKSSIEAFLVGETVRTFRYHK